MYVPIGKSLGVASVMVIIASCSVFTMASIRKVLHSYLEETALHGFKYLGRSGNVGSKCYWLLAILSTTAFGGWLIGTGIMDWEENPVVTTINSIHTPIKDVQFPTITFCRNDNSNLDEWELVEHVFNFFELKCKNDPCPDIEMLRKDLRPFFVRFYEYASKIVQNYNFGWPRWVNQTVIAIQRNLTTIAKLEADFLSVIGSNAGGYAFVRKFILPMGLENEKLSECDDQCQQLGKRISIFFEATSKVLSEAYDNHLGTTLRKNAALIGTTFSNPRIELTLDLCHQINGVESMIHEVMLQLGSSMGLNVSLLDLPKFFKSMSTKEKGKAKMICALHLALAV